MALTFREAYDTILSELGEGLGAIDEKEVTHVVERIIEKKNVFVVGAGRVGLMLRTFAMRLLHLGFGSHIAGSVTCPPIGGGDLLLVASSSGETATILEVVRRAHRVGAEIIALTARPTSAIARLASGTLFIEAPSSLVHAGEGGIVSDQPMKTLFEQSLFVLLESMVLLLMQQTGQKADDMVRRHTNLE
jgi:6-phospho-3-hexuloisomerase